MKIAPSKRLSGTIPIPGDKSISHRAAMLAALAIGESRIENFAANADCQSTLRCLKQLGVDIRREGSTLHVQGFGKSGFEKPCEPLDCGNSGTTMRLLAGILAGQNFKSFLTGDDSVCNRPMKRIIEPLEKMGAKVESWKGHAPLKIHGRNPLESIKYDLPVASAQVKSCILLAGLSAEGTTTVHEKTQTRDHTERMMKMFGADIYSDETAGEIRVSGDSELKAVDFRIPGDISSAAFFIAAAACLEGSEIVMKDVGINPTRMAFIDLLKRLGADIEIGTPTSRRQRASESVPLHGVEPLATLTVHGRINLSSACGNIINGKMVANLIDEIPILAVVGTQIEGGVEIRDASELRVKESDRIATVVENLRRMNAKVTEYPDGLRVERSPLCGAEIDSFGDHRIAMAFAIAALFATGETEIIDAECASVSFPGFYDVLGEAAMFN